MSEKRSVTVGKRSIEFLFTRKRVKNLNLRIRRDGSVSVSAPTHTPFSRVDAFVRENAELILRSRERVEKYASLRALLDGDTVFFLGEPYRLAVSEGARALEFRDGEARLSLPHTQGDVEEAYLALVAHMIYPLIRERCLAMEEAFPRLKGRLKELRVRPLKSMWGNCRPDLGRITFSSSLASMPIPLIDGVIAHEYAHFLHRGHGKDFYAFLATLTPNYKELSLSLTRTKREQLRKRK